MTQSIAIISDIHSNSIALEAVLKDISARDIKLIVNLGDSLFGPIDPVGTARLLMNNTDVINIMGNCDQILLKEESDSATYKFVKPFINDEIKQWIRSFKTTWEFETILFCHGTPFSNEQYLLEEVNEMGVQYKNQQQLSMELEEVPHHYIFCGHSHVFRTIYLPSGKLIVNSGSVGLPAYDDEAPFPHVMESNSPYADYVIAHKTEDGNWSIEHIMIHYDWDKASSIAEDNGRRDYAFAIKTGRALRE
ncbi:metallophosphoesterase [Paenibacillus anaericanus]|uniref:Metallophosphoesterase n=1 Tax=Paenibacillus anaericanus TaxID=170367 RepID=A0A433Y681_9BACL|nr:metallophosphoesterase family protein [Paenibacillus anaericanus]RUT44448.1 metallophosphoesterase [Paenibacillus anaericanus]